MTGRKTLAIGTIFLTLVVGAGVGAAASHSAVRIGGDEIDGGVWRVSISRIGGRFGDGPKGRLRPCLSVFGARPLAGDSETEFIGSGSTLCAASPSLTAEDEPLIVEGGEITPQHAIESKLTVVAIAMAPRVARVTLTNFDGTETTYDTQALTGRQAKKARLARLRHVEFAIAGPYCVDHIVSYDAQGRPLWESGKLGRCPPQEFPRPWPPAQPGSARHD